MTTTTNRTVRQHRTADYERHPENFYPEPDWVWSVLFDMVRFKGDIYDPCAGIGTLLPVAERYGYRVAGTDLVQRSERVPGGVDFMAGDAAALPKVDNIVSNPPFDARSPELVQRALVVARNRVALLFPVRFLFSQARYPLFTTTPVSHIIGLSARPSLPPGDLLLAGEVRAAGGKTDYVIVIWTHGCTTPPTWLWGMPRPGTARPPRRKPSSK